ncbi:hypothetical protein KA017_00800 [Candidatus Woesebacteria bacterium]|nr:hypothetical protein [Candidatus Woesebacteria bacterium]
MQIKIVKKTFLNLLFFLLVSGTAFGLGFYTNNYYTKLYDSLELLNPFVDSGVLISKPLLAYSIPSLQKREYQTSKIALEKILTEEESYTSFLFSYTTLGRKMTGQLNIPDAITANPDQDKKAIILLRGYVPAEIYTTGVGTKNAAAALAQAGYITIAPDFFGFGDSDPEPENTWAARFEKPITVVELIKSIETNGIPLNLESERTNNTLDLDVTKISNIGLWAHSNGGQIALTTLEILRKPIPTTLWAPVTAPFPYSVLYFSDELEDEGKEQRKWISLFEEDYDVFEFSLTKHLDSLTGPIQIQHGTADDAALIFWSQEFITKVTTENKQRLADTKELEALAATTSAREASAAAKPQPLPAIEINLITYQNTNHNMVPNWDKAIQKDLQFFAKWLK